MSENKEYVEEQALKKVYVDASDRRKLITLVVEGEKKALQDSTLNYAGYKITTDEAEYCGIISALKNISGNLEIINDNQSVVAVLNGKGRITQKSEPYIEWIRKLCENRLISFTYGSRDVNEAGLKQEGYSLYEIRNAELMEMMKQMKESTKRKTLKAWRRLGKKKEGVKP